MTRIDMHRSRRPDVIDSYNFSTRCKKCYFIVFTQQLDTDGWRAMLGGCVVSSVESVLHL